MCKQTTDNLEHIYTHLVIHEGGNAYFTNRSKWLCIHNPTRLKKKAFKTESSGETLFEIRFSARFRSS